MLGTSEVELERLPDGIDDNIIALVDFWYAALGRKEDDGLPSRTVLSGDRLGRWRDDISIYEYQPERDDFLVRLVAPNIVYARGESFQGGTPRAIDMKYGTCLTAGLHKTLKQKRPTFHHISTDGLSGETRHWMRILLPAQTLDRFQVPVRQVLGAQFSCAPMYML